MLNIFNFDIIHFWLDNQLLPVLHQQGFLSSSEFASCLLVPETIVSFLDSHAYLHLALSYEQ